MKGPYNDELEQSGHFPLRRTFTEELVSVKKNKSHYSVDVEFDKIDEDILLINKVAIFVTGSS